ncbi:benzoate-CoA ligase family protein [soil metagenome]
MREAALEHAYNAAELLYRNLDAGRSAHPYLTTGSRKWTYQEVCAAADTAGAGLLSEGLEQDARVVLALRDRAEFVIAFWGAMKAGLVPVPVAQGLTASDVHFILSDSAASAVVCDRSSAPEVTAAAEHTAARVVIVGEQASREALRWSELCANSGSLPTTRTTESDIALWLYTSGTTGLPKAVMHRHGSLKAAPAALSDQVIGLQPDDLVLSVSKMFFAYGLGNSVYLPAAAGACVILNEGPVIPGRINELVAATRPTVIFGIPSFFSGFTRLPDASLPSSTRMVLSAGEALSAPLFDGFKARFELPLLDGLGSTEALHHVTNNRPDDAVPGSAGRPLEGYEIDVRDVGGERLTEGISGELWIRGPTLFAGYWKRPELTDRVRRDGWVRTGDRVRVEEGRLYHEGRLDDLIKLGGIWLAPAEIEDVLRSHPDVTDAAVITADDRSGVPTLKAFVASGRAPRELVAEIRALCKSHLARAKAPTTFEVLPELPRTASGKLQRFILRSRP